MIINKLISICFIVIGSWIASSVAWADQPFPTPATGGLPQCEAELATCKATAQTFPATGQKTCWNIEGFQIPCAGTGHDGDIQAGAELSYTDTGLTIIDNNTKLEWMKQDDNGGDCASLPGSLDKDCVFNWEESFTLVTALNASEFAGYTDWRVPNVKELLSIVNHENFSPSVSGAFNSGCEQGCTYETCSCTAVKVGSDLSLYWSSTTIAVLTGNAWDVNFDYGVILGNGKYKPNRVRAVRGGF